MKKLYFYQGKATLAEVPEPQQLAGWVLVKNSYSFVSAGTERQTLNLQAKSLFGRFADKFVDNANKLSKLVQNEGLTSAFYQLKGVAHKLLESGYACAGQVVWADVDSGLLPGDFVACAGAGFACHAELVAVPKNLTVKLAGATHLKAASATAIAAVALQGLRQADCHFGETLLVQGLGLVGLLTVQLAVLAGLKVVGVDPNPARLALAKEFGCQQVFSADDSGLVSGVSFFTDHHGVDAVIVCAGGGQNVLDLALQLVRKQGKVVVVGEVPLTFLRQHFYHKQVSILASCSYGPGRYEPNFERDGLDYPFEFVRWTEQRNLALCAQLIEQQKLKIEPLVSQTFNFKQAGKAFDYLASPDCLGLALEFQDSACALKKPVDKVVVQEPKAFRFMPAKNILNLAIVGAGGFAKTRLIPELLSLGNNCLYAVVDPCASNALNVAAQFGIPRQFSSLTTALQDPNLDAVIIASPHSEHFEQTLEALEKGKAVFVEKPPVVNLQQLHQLEGFLREHPQAFYCVDFNRSHSPYLTKIGSALSNRATPLVIEYRVNAGFLASNHWVFSAKNNGRIIGEACHMVDFLMALTGSTVASVAVNRMAGPAGNSKDNFVASMSFIDNSQASLLYTSLGHLSQDKERVEIFWQGSSIVLTDFCQLQGFGTPMFFNQRSLSPEKGHSQVLQLFLQALKKQDPTMLVVARERALQATYVTLIIKDLVDTGGGFVQLDELTPTFASQHVAE